MSVTVVDAGRNRVTRSVIVEAPATELFEIVADPRRHSDLDGSGTVRSTVRGPERLFEGARFSVNMKQLGFPYRITSRVTKFANGRLIEWRHPVGHRWRWEFSPLSDGSTRVTETFDYSRGNAGGRLAALYYNAIRAPKQNAAGIEATLDQLRRRYAN
jgi:hypothetical protein